MANPAAYSQIRLARPTRNKLQLPGNFDGADLIVSYDRLDEWVTGDSAPQMMAMAFATLKPGGSFGIIQKDGPSAEAIIALAKTAGFPTAERKDLAGGVVLKFTKPAA